MRANGIKTEVEIKEIGRKERGRKNTKENGSGT